MRSNDVLQRQLELLKSAVEEDVAGRERAWSEEIGNRLDAVERALRQHTEAAETSGGLFGQLDVTRLSRRVSELSHEHVELGTQLHALRQEIAQAAQAFRQDVGATSTTLVPARTVGTVPDFTVLKQRLDEFCRDLDRHGEAEAGLVLESVNTDIGAGD